MPSSICTSTSRGETLENQTNTSNSFLVPEPPVGTKPRKSRNSKGSDNDHSEALKSNSLPLVSQHGN